MKTTLKSVVLSILIIIGMTWTSWSQTTSITITAPAWGSENHYICESQYNQMIIRKPAWALTGVEFYDGGSTHLIQDSLIVTSANDGVWFMVSMEGNVTIGAYIVSPPSKPWTQTDIPNCGLLNAQPGAQPGTTYIWSTGATTQTITAQTPGLYIVTVTNTCGSIVDSMNIYWTGSLPSLGADDTICNGTTLTPGTFTSYLWNDNSTASTLNVTTDGTYAVTVTNIHNCRATDAITLVVENTPSQEIALATINTNPADPNYGNNMITWDVEPGFNVAGNMVNVYRESGTNNYVLMGTANYADTTWTDVVNSTAHAWKYKITLVGPCGEGALSAFVQTIHCWVTANMGGGYTVQWDPYLVETKAKSVTWYKVLSGNGLDQLAIRDSVSGSLTSLTLLTTTDSIIVVGAEISGAKGVGTLALSNKSTNPDILTGLIESPAKDILEIYPNPTNGIINIAGVEGNSQIDVYDFSGRLILHVENTNNIDLTEFPQGTYVVRVITESGVLTEKVIRQ